MVSGVFKVWANSASSVLSLGSRDSVGIIITLGPEIRSAHQGIDLIVISSASIAAELQEYREYLVDLQLLICAVWIRLDKTD